MTFDIPTSHAENAYDLLSEIIELIREEPLRYDQHHLLIRRQSDAFLLSPRRGWPPCGTVGCVAGWVIALKNPKRHRDSLLIITAQHVLGLDTLQAIELFSSDAVRHGGQTPEHASDGITHIQAFQQKYRAQLQNTKV